MASNLNAAPEGISKSPNKIPRRRFLQFLGGALAGAAVAASQIPRFGADAHTESLRQGNAHLDYDPKKDDPETRKQKAEYLVELLNSLKQSPVLSTSSLLEMQLILDKEMQGFESLYVVFEKQDDGSYTTSKNAWDLLTTRDNRAENIEHKTREQYTAAKSFDSLIEKLTIVLSTDSPQLRDFNLTVRLSKEGFEKLSGRTMDEYGPRIKKYLQSYSNIDYSNEPITYTLFQLVQFNSSKPKTYDPVLDESLPELRFEMQKAHTKIFMLGPLLSSGHMVYTYTEFDTSTLTMLSGGDIPVELPVTEQPSHGEGRLIAQRIPLIPEQEEGKKLLLELTRDIVGQQQKLIEHVRDLWPRPGSRL